ncbi:hypothetical protein PF002_g7507 [Phytophthora fragariae]|uniref:Uncharacterized protein n=1 Tax=Phytophthora fragariae TaxID=53985 RepID=A0A6A3ZW89_9STRA|nr:hypothetical protein PF002_g7507 [Phytophthora fragariae]
MRCTTPMPAFTRSGGWCRVVADDVVTAALVVVTVIVVARGPDVTRTRQLPCGDTADGGSRVEVAEGMSGDAKNAPGLGEVAEFESSRRWGPHERDLTAEESS